MSRENQTQDELEFGLDADIFKSMRKDFNRTLTRALFRMRQRDVEEATISLKLSVCLVELDGEMPDGDIKTIQKPEFKYKVSFTLQEKEEYSNEGKEDYELIEKADKSGFFLRRIQKDQMSLFL